MSPPIEESLSDPLTRAALVASAIRRIDRARNKTIDHLNALRRAGTPPANLLRHSLIAIMQWRAQKRRLMVSSDAAELAAIIENIGPKGTKLPYPQIPHPDPDNDIPHLLPEGANDALAASMERFAHKGPETIFGARPSPPR